MNNFAFKYGVIIGAIIASVLAIITGSYSVLVWTTLAVIQQIWINTQDELWKEINDLADFFITENSRLTEMLDQKINEEAE